MNLHSIARHEELCGVSCRLEMQLGVSALERECVLFRVWGADGVLALEQSFPLSHPSARAVTEILWPLLKVAICAEDANGKPAIKFETLQQTAREWFAEYDGAGHPVTE